MQTFDNFPKMSKISGFPVYSLLIPGIFKPLNFAALHMPHFYLMVLVDYPGGHTLAVEAAVRAAGTVTPAALHQEAARPEDGVRPLELLP
jgi:hypothetical protein